MKHSAPPNESARLEALSQYGMLDTKPEAGFDEIIQMASQICQTPIALISLVDQERVWFKAKLGLKVNEVARDGAFCAHVILQKDPLVVSNAQEDPRFRKNTLVSSEPSARFYAGVQLLTPAGHVLGTLCVMDVISREVTSEQLESLRVLARQVMQLLETRRSNSEMSFAYYDSITNLPNQELFKDRLQQAMAQTTRNKQMVAVMLVSLDRFKTINDTLGYVTSDQMLRAVAQRIVACVRESDTVARFGSDEFALLLTHQKRAEDAARVALAVGEALSAPFTFDDQELFITTSIGISHFPHDGRDTVTLLKSAGTALNRAREQDGDSYQFYTSGRTTKALRKLLLENNLRPALERNEFILHYQPQVDLESFQVVGSEALIRWQHPGLGLLQPVEFIRVAEDSGLIVALGEWTMRAACLQTKSWLDAGLEPLRVGINLSARQFQQPNLVETVARILRETDLDPRFLELELTEGSIMKDPDQAIGKLHELKAMGVRISIDDFGTGYSSLSYLKRFPVDTLKIDQSFVTDINTDSDDAAIVAAIIDLAHALKLNVIAEGVETQEQLDYLQMLKCDEVQGFLFSKPLSVEEFTELLMEINSLQLRKNCATSPLHSLVDSLR